VLFFRVQGWTSTITAPTEAPRRRHPDQIKEMKVRLHPTARECLRVLCSDAHTTVVVLSGSDRQALDEVSLAWGNSSL
jgi:trehalose 6-phosphate synthase/phosphatase